jgi:hypothetical protein
MCTTPQCDVLLSLKYVADGIVSTYFSTTYWSGKILYPSDYLVQKQKPKNRLKSINHERYVIVSYSVCKIKISGSLKYSKVVCYGGYHSVLGDGGE